MKTRSILVLSALLLLSALSATAQSSFKLDPKAFTFIDNAMMECIYKYTVNAPVKKSQTNEKQLETYTTILQANASVSKFWDWHLFKKDSIICTSAPELTIDDVNKLEWKYNLKVKDLFKPVVVKNYPDGKITVTDEIIPNDYTYNENKIERNWTLKDDTLTVCGYLCNKAVTSFGGREWTVWYAPDITLSDGPWKLYGLPGLILKADDATGTHSFVATTIRQSLRPIYVSENFMQLKISKDQFIKSRNRFVEDPQKNLLAAQPKSITVFKDVGILVIDGRRAKMNIETTYCPLELE